MCALDCRVWCAPDAAEVVDGAVCLLVVDDVAQWGALLGCPPRRAGSGFWGKHGVLLGSVFGAISNSYATDAGSMVVNSATTGGLMVIVVEPP